MEELLAGLPPKRSVYHALEISMDVKPPLRQLYQLSLAELFCGGGVCDGSPVEMEDL